MTPIHLALFQTMADRQMRVRGKTELFLLEQKLPQNTGDILKAHFGQLNVQFLKFWSQVKLTYDMLDLIIHHLIKMHIPIG